MKLELVELSAVHAALAAAIHRQCFDDPWTPEAFAAMLALPGTFGLIAGDGHPVGIILCRTAADEAEVITLGVLPSARGHGIAGRLLDTAMDMARGCMVAAIFLEVAEHNESALALYRGRSFLPVGRRANYYGPGQHAIILRRQL